MRPSTWAELRTMCKSAILPNSCAAAVPGSLVTFATEAGPDLRDYRVDFSKLNAVFPDLRLRWSVPAGVDELVRAYTDYGFSHEDFVSSSFVRLRRIQELLSAGIVDDMLRLQPTAVPAASGS